MKDEYHAALRYSQNDVDEITKPRHAEIEREDGEWAKEGIDNILGCDDYECIGVEVEP